MHGLLLVQPVPAQDREDQLGQPGRAGEQLGVRRIGRPLDRAVPARVGLGVRPPGRGAGQQRVPPGPADGRRAELLGEVAQAGQGEPAVQVVQAADVLVERGHPHAQPLGQRRQRQGLDAALVGQRGRLGDHPVRGEPGPAGHASFATKPATAGATSSTRLGLRVVPDALDHDHLGRSAEVLGGEPGLRGRVREVGVLAAHDHQSRRVHARQQWRRVPVGALVRGHPGQRVVAVRSLEVRRELRLAGRVVRRPALEERRPGERRPQWTARERAVEEREEPLLQHGPLAVADERAGQHQAADRLGLARGGDHRGAAGVAVADQHAPAAVRVQEREQVVRDRAHPVGVPAGAGLAVPAQVGVHHLRAVGGQPLGQPVEGRAQVTHAGGEHDEGTVRVAGQLVRQPAGRPVQEGSRHG